MTECSRCGKSCIVPCSSESISDPVVFGIEIVLTDIQNMQEQLGKYYVEGKTEYKWGFCWECFIDAYMQPTLEGDVC